MAGETIRDVVVKLRLEQIQAKLVAPDTSLVKQAMTDVNAEISRVSASTREVNKLLGFDLSQSGAAAKKATDATTQAIIRQEESIDDVYAAMQRLVDIETRQTGALQQQIPVLNTVSQKYTADFARSQAAAQAALQKTQDRSLEAVNEFVKLSSGALSVAQGMALLGLSSEESLAKFVKTFAQFQAGINILRGGKDVIEGSVKGYRALTAAGGLVAASNTLVAGSQTLVATTANVATAAMARLALVMRAHPVVAVLSLAAVAVAGLSAAWEFFDDADEPVDKAADAVGRLARVTTEANRVMTESQKKFQSASTRFDLREQFDDLEFDQSLEARTERLRAAREEYDRARTVLVGIPKSPSETDDQHRSRLLQGRIVSNQRLAELGRTEIALNDEKHKQLKEQLAAIREQEQAAIELVRIRGQEVEKIEDAIRAERSRIRSESEGIGRLDAAQLAEAKRLSDRAAKGDTFNEAELKRIEDLLGRSGQEFVAQQFAKIGEQRGGAGLLDPFQRRTDIEGKGAGETRLEGLERQQEDALRRQDTAREQMMRVAVEQQKRQEQFVTELEGIEKDRSRILSDLRSSIRTLVDDRNELERIKKLIDAKIEQNQIKASAGGVPAGWGAP